MLELKEINLNRFQLHVLLNEEEMEAYRYIVQEGTYCVHCKAVCVDGVDVKENILNGTNDILIRGICNKCKGNVSRFIEYGEFEDFVERANSFRKAIGE